MARKFAELEAKLKAKMTPEQLKEHEKGIQRTLDEYERLQSVSDLMTWPLPEIRQACELSQEELAKRLKTKQSNVSKMERRKDMTVSKLRALINAMGGELDIVARFPDGSVKVGGVGDAKDI